MDGDEDPGALGEPRSDGLGGAECIALDSEGVVDAPYLGEAAQEDDPIARSVRSACRGFDAILGQAARHQFGEARASVDDCNRTGVEQPPESETGRRCRFETKCPAHRLGHLRGGAPGGRSRSGPPCWRGFTAAGLLHPVYDLLEGAQLAEFGGVDLGQVGRLISHGGEDLDALDGVDAEVAGEVHGELEHVDGVAGLFGDDREHEGL
ncbi:MAG: hypothetical protein JRH11_16750 [Deltaproteobacteria bacterium]|nr:hypothetical protein [Deltaproteobacteria bacterium]